MRTTASIAQVKARLSDYLRRVKRGDDVIITERGAPIARLTALEVTERRATRRERLARLGVVRPGRGRPRKALLSPPAGMPEATGDESTWPGAGVLDALITDRREDR
jgi:prevent-host-death family protein